MLRASVIPRSYYAPKAFLVIGFLRTSSLAVRLPNPARRAGGSLAAETGARSARRIAATSASRLTAVQAACPDLPPAALCGSPPVRQDPRLLPANLFEGLVSAYRLRRLLRPPQIPEVETASPRNQPFAVLLARAIAASTWGFADLTAV